MIVTPIRLKKIAAESRQYDFDFTNQVEIAAGQTLTGTPTVTSSPSGLTLTGPVLDSTNKKAQVTISGGTVNETYEVTCTVGTSGGATLVACGELLIIEC